MTKNLFNLSVPNISSRVTVMREADMKKDIPPFQADYFKNDLDQLFLKVNTPEDLSSAVLQMNDAYVWPCSSFGFFVKDAQKGELKAINTGKVNLSTEALDINSKNGIANFVISSKRSTYIPDTSFTRSKAVYQMPEDTMKLIQDNKTILIEPLNEAHLKKIDLSSLRDRIYLHSGSLVMLPLWRKDENFGLIGIGYSPLFMFADKEQDKINGRFEMLYLSYLQMLGDASARTLEKIKLTH